RTIDNSAGNRQQVIVIDVDNDNDLDFFVTNNFPFEVIFYRNDGLTTHVKDGLTLKVPGEFGLRQNYPNPFNPTTTIEFALPKPSDVTLILFDILGGEVKTLVSKKMGPGVHNITLNAEGLASGVYFYRIKAGEYSQMKKVLLLK
ncbi:MAG: T9SS type A sorting domain-containing protein, partial [bacterium]